MILADGEVDVFCAIPDIDDEHVTSGSDRQGINAPCINEETLMMPHLNLCIEDYRHNC
jgi:hypothetical protein